MNKTQIALSIRQPWAWLIAHGLKDIENRDWSTKFRGRFLIHTGKKVDAAAWDWIRDQFNIDLPGPRVIETGGIVGEAELVDCVTDHDSPWFFGKYGFVIENARPRPFLAVAGQLGFFAIATIPIELHPFETKVVHCTRDEITVAAAKRTGRYVYIGRPTHIQAWRFGNPFASQPGTKAARVVNDPITAYRQWLLGGAHIDLMQEERAWVLERIPLLKGKVLGCWCAPEPCHGDVLKELANKK